MNEWISLVAKLANGAKFHLKHSKQFLNLLRPVKLRDEKFSPDDGSSSLLLRRINLMPILLHQSTRVKLSLKTLN
jgi:hypothetical protein